MNDLIIPKTLKPYHSADIETTGLSVKTSQILSIGIVYDPDGVTPIDQLPKTRILIKPTTVNGKVPGEEIALNMNSKLIEEALDIGVSLGEARSILMDYINSHVDGETVKKITFAGKNFSEFDSKFIEHWLTDFDSKKSHRVIDVGNHYYGYFGKVPSLDEINKLVFGPERSVAHTEIEDAINVVECVRFQYFFQEALIQNVLNGIEIPDKYQDFLSKLKKAGKFQS